ncbi:MAG: ATP-binding cassette domain-containing protein [Alphaproteobacteria bacterium]|nr:ATP-binding cassette domain-containing protein [Alphaproteobacteria bacterium]
MLCLFQTAVFVMLLRLWYQKQINIGDVTLVLMLVNSVTHCFTQILAKVCDLNSLSGALEAAMLPLTVKHDIKNAHGAKKLKIKNQEIVFDHVGFAYDNKTVFKNLSFVIKKHEKIGIVGLSGSGKTTLINLLQRAYDVSQGKIYIDGQDIARVTLHSLHNAIAIIPQDTSLFHRTIAQNIAYGRHNASMADIKKAAIKAWADEFICDLPQGYQTKVGEKGVKLSGGERQRIAIARAIVKNSPILILDEATSSLDSKTEKYIQRAMKNLMKGKTVIAAAHRLSTLKEMDRIIVLNNGCIAEQGTIAELLALNGLFKNFWDIQSKKTPA